MKITERMKLKMLKLIAKHMRKNGRKPDSEYLAEQIPGYNRQQYAAVIAHHTMGTYKGHLRNPSNTTRANKKYPTKRIPPVKANKSNAKKSRKSNMYKNVKTWSPFVGCKYDCSYCRLSYRRQMKRRKRKCMMCYNYTPHYHPNRLTVYLPKKKILWPCAYGDISFARPSYIRKVIARANNESSRYREIYYQSKNPKCISQYIKYLSENAVLLTTLETNRNKGYSSVSSAPRPSKRAKDFAALKWPRKIVTIEPILDFDEKGFFQLIKNIDPMAIWIGYNSKGRCGLVEPPLEKTRHFIRKLRAAGYKVIPKTMRAARIPG